MAETVAYRIELARACAKDLRVGGQPALDDMRRRSAIDWYTHLASALAATEQELDAMIASTGSRRKVALLEGHRRDRLTAHERMEEAVQRRRLR